eukprot:Gb_11283 [translate_table: standard]
MTKHQQSVGLPPLLPYCLITTSKLGSCHPQDEPHSSRANRDRNLLQSRNPTPMNPPNTTMPCKMRQKTGSYLRTFEEASRTPGERAIVESRNAQRMGNRNRQTKKGGLCEQATNNQKNSVNGHKAYCSDPMRFTVVVIETSKPANLHLKIFVPLTVLAFTVLVPVDATAGALNHLDKDLVFSDIDKLSISNVKSGSHRRYPPCWNGKSAYISHSLLPIGIGQEIAPTMM